MRLSEAQQEFAYHVGCLLLHIWARPNYTCSLGDAYRDPRAFGPLGEQRLYSSANSFHKQRLAQDINLFFDGKYVTDPEHYWQFAEYWESLHPDNRAGIRFNDANHFERIWPSTGKSLPPLQKPEGI